MKTNSHTTLFTAFFYSLLAAVSAFAQDNSKPNILVIWGDDIGISNISFNSRGLVGYRTPNIDRIATEGIAFTDYYGQQSCTAGRAAFVGGNNPLRTGMTKVGLPGAPEGWQTTDITIAAALKTQGYATGQFGKNHFGDRDEHLPTNNGFDEFFGNLYHLNAEEEPEHPDYPKDPEFRKKFGPRGVVSATAGGAIEDTGPLTRKRMETVDDETLAKAIDFIDRKQKTGEPWFCWWNGTRMHFRTHVKEENSGVTGLGDYADGMVEHDGHVGQLLDKLEELGIVQNTIVMYSTDNGVHYNTWPDAGITPFRSEKNSNWEGAFRVPAFVRWPAQWQAGVVKNGMVAHQDWFPTFLAVAGEPDIKTKLRTGFEAIGRTYKNYIDGIDLNDYLSGKSEESPRTEFWYVGDTGEILAARVGRWKAVFMENRAKGMQIWREPFVTLRAPKIFDLRGDPYERADESANVYDDWWLDHAFVFAPFMARAAELAQTLKEFPPSQSPGSFNLDRVQRMLETQSGSH